MTESRKDLVESTPRLPGEGYSEAERVRGVQAVALNAGNTRRAARLLKEQGQPIPRSTLKHWVTVTHVAEYERARIVVRDRIWDELAEEHQALARKALKATGDATAAAREMVKQGDAKTANSYASAARNLATVAGISNDKASAAHGRPTVIERRVDIPRALARLVQMGVIETEPGEVIDAAEVEEL
jgi:hypothetical protein